MSTGNNRKGVIVGLFIFFGIAILVAGVLTLGGQKKSFVNAVKVRAVFTDVNGLTVGNNVWFSGVKVGTIKSIEFDPQANVVVQMNVEEKVRKFIASDSRVKIGSDGLIGNKIIVIFGGTPGGEPIQDNATLAVEDVLSQEEMLATLQSNNENLLAITADFKVLTSRIVAGEGSVGKLLADETLFTDLQTTMASLKNASRNATDVVSDLSAYTSKLTEKGTLAGDLVSDTVIFSRLRATIGQINEAAVQSNAIVQEVATAARQLNRPGSPAGALLHDEGVANDLKNTLKNLETASEKLDENMEALQHNFLFRGYFRKKARQERK